jgi:hypothetical protein
MSHYKTDQHHLVYRGRSFHFVSYEAREANPRTGEAAMPASWFLMSSGKRWPVIAYNPDQAPEAVVAALTLWLDRNVFTVPSR